jgi:hypothetical protein
LGHGSGFEGVRLEGPGSGVWGVGVRFRVENAGLMG